MADRQSRERFVRAYDEAHRLAEVGPGRLVLTVGTALRIKFTLARETGRVDSVDVLDSSDAKLKKCSEAVMRDKMDVGPFRGGKPFYTVTHKF